MRLFPILAILAWQLFIACAPSHAAVVTVTSSNTSVHAADTSNVGASTVSDTGTGLNRVAIISAVDGNASSTTTLTWTSALGFTEFRFDLVQSVGANPTPFSNTSSDSNVLLFTVDSNTTYEISGLWTLNGTAVVTSDVHLSDETAGGFLFVDRSVSFNTPNEVFVLGTPNDGDFNNTTAGSLTGTLTAGHSYAFYFADSINVGQTGSTFASAEGFLRLQIGSPPVTGAVPEPASVGLWSLGALGCALAAHRRRKAPAR